MSIAAVASRVGRKPIIIPRGVDIKIDSANVSVKGPKGHLHLPIHPYVNMNIEADHIHITMNEKRDYCRTGSGSKLVGSIPGTFRAKLQNAVHGVSNGFERKLVLVGVGYRAQITGKVLSLTVGLSHPVKFDMPEGITIETPAVTEIVIKGANKRLVGHMASIIREVRPPEPYKGKGIRYSDEKIILKETKKK